MQRNLSRPDRRGIALPTALFALVVIGTLVAGVFFTARLEIRGGENAMSATRAAEAAQGGLMIGVPNVLTIGGALADGQTATAAKTQIGSTGAYYENSVTRLNRYIYLLRSNGTYEYNGTVLASRTMAQLVKRYMPELEVNSGAIVAGDVTVQGSVELRGNDAVPAGWTGCATGPDQPSIRSDNTITTKGGVTATPAPSSNDTTVGNMARVLDTLFMQLASQANITFTGDPGTPVPVDTTIGGVAQCNTSKRTNWGDLVHTGSTTHCSDYYPLIYLNPGGPGNSVGIHGGSGQGILLVNGDLKMNGNFKFAGLVLVRGTYETGGGTMDLTGSMLSSLVDTDPNKWTGGLKVQYSTCAINNALNNLAVTAPTQYRGFIQF